MLRWPLVVCASLVLATAVHAQPYALDPDTRDQVTFAVERETRVDNDEMTVVLMAVETDLDAAAAADRVNRTMQELMPAVRAAEGVEFRTGAYRTHAFHPQPPPPQRPREQRWRVEQELILAARDFDALRALVSELQPRLNLKSVGFGLSQERRIEAGREMQAAALAAFREDAERIRTALGATGFEIVELDVSAGPPDPVRSRARLASMAMAAESEPTVAPVVLEGGHSEVVARVRARIQLLR